MKQQWMRHWHEARRHRDDPELDHNDFVSGLNLDEYQKERILASLLVNLPEDTPSQIEGPVGIYDHYLSHLEEQHGRGVRDAVDDSVRDTRMRMNIRRPEENRTGYGLVVGRIQSGKTAHLLGLSLHAMDPSQTEERFDIVIILSGLIDDLRIQTHNRLNESIRGFSGNAPLLLPGVESDLSSEDWGTLGMVRSAFSNPGHRGVILVLKKNHRILSLLYSQIIRAYNHQNHGRRILLIDDESDHASIDTSEIPLGEAEAEIGEDDFDYENEIDEDPSETNRRLRQIIRNGLSLSHSTSWYIGYTATPFANLLSPESVTTEEDEYGLSLAPRDLIHSLPEPEGHTDNQYYFATPDRDEVVTVTPPEINSNAEIQELRDLVIRHLATDLIKEERGILNKHHTTLVHTSRIVNEHRRVAEALREIIEGMMESYEIGAVLSELRDEVRTYVEEEEFGRLEGRLSQLEQGDFVDLVDRLEKIEVIEVNRRRRGEDEDSPQNLRYGIGSSRKSYIAVGGTRLSRGLTLEGLTTTYFTRTSQRPKYDTLMQMARWCGYRTQSNISYHDLVRIFTTEDIRNSFRDIALAEEDMRHRIEAIPIGDSPLEHEIWIRETPGHHVTSPNKMRLVRRRTWGAMGTSPIWTYRCPALSGIDPGRVSRELYSSFESLVTDVGATIELGTPRNGLTNFVIARGVPSQMIKRFLDEYCSFYNRNARKTRFFRRIAEISEGLDPNNGDQNWDREITWSLGLHTPNRYRGEPHNLPFFGEVGLINRSSNSIPELRIIHNSARDATVDLAANELRTNPLILLYLVNPRSTQDDVREDQGGQFVFPPPIVEGGTPVPVFGICMPHPGGQVDGGSAVSRGG